MRFVTRATGRTVALNIFSEKRMTCVPADVRFSGVAFGRIVRQGISLKGLETMALVTTPTELIIFGSNSDVKWRKPLAGLKAQKQSIDSVLLVAADGEEARFVTGAHGRKEIISHVFEAARVEQLPGEWVTVEESPDALDRADIRAGAKSVNDLWTESKIVGGSLTQKASNAILRQCLDDRPWFILVSNGGGGVLVAFEDRLAIIKTGAWTSFMAGSLGGERSTTFYYRDVNALEYNSGFMNGVLEVLTASYNGTANRDFWRGSNQSRNADSNDPFTLSNTLPLTKFEYNAALPEIKELKKKISQAKDMNVTVNVPAPTELVAPSTSIIDELTKLAALRDSGIVSDEEFEELKKQLVAKSRLDI